MADLRYSSTYSRTLISYSESLSHLIRKYSIAPVETRRVGEFAVARWTLLTEAQIDEALLNPQSSIPLGIQVYGAQLKNIKQLMDLELEIQNQTHIIEVALKEVREKYAKADSTQQTRFLDIIQELEASYKKLTSLRNDISQLGKELPRSKIELNQINFEKDDDWENFRKNTLEQIAEYLVESNMPLNDQERTALEIPESMAEVIRRFKILHLEIPSYINLKEPDYNTYFELKTYLAIHASLARRMLPHSTEDVLKWQESGS